MVFLKLAQVHHKRQPFWIKVVYLVPNVQTLAGHAVGTICLAPTTTLHFKTVHRTKYSFSHWIFYPPTGTTMPNHKQMENKFFNQPLNSRPGEVK
jgi:hypothetical protein